jgi:diguanylate cyclase (GGDEF)-like protein
VSERKRLEAQLVHQAFHDPLTGLANRELLRDRVSHALIVARRQGRSPVVLFLDLDDFKKVNDSLGHAEGDRLLIAAARRLVSCARASDTVARLGGDEFAILIEDVASPGAYANVVERISELMAQPFPLNGTEVFVNASIGIAVARGDETADELLRDADVAMYTAKRGGKGRHATFHAGMHAGVVERLALEAQLRRAVDHGELVLHFQPIVSLRTGALQGVEALVRWQHPELGLLAPARFIELAEETGIVVLLGQWVLREACQHARRWRERFPETPLSVSVNVSGRQLQSPDVVEEVRAVLVETGVDARAVALEITESVLMQHSEATLDKLLRLKALGVSLALDDFGTGYSSLGYLQRFPIDILKIAKPFVDDVGGGVSRPALARAIIALGASLRVRTVAEGIESADQWAALAELGCELGQGYHFAEPVPAEAIDDLLTHGPAWTTTDGLTRAAVPRFAS